MFQSLGSTAFLPPEVSNEFLQSVFCSFFPRRCSQSALFMCCSICFNRHMSVSHSSAFSLCWFHFIIFYIFCQSLKMVSLCRSNWPKWLSVSIFYCLHLGAGNVKRGSKKWENVVEWNVLLGKDRAPWSRVSKEDSQQHEADERPNHLKDEALRSVESSPRHGLTQPPTTRRGPPPSYQRKPRTRAAPFTATGCVIHPKSRSQMVQRCWRNTDFLLHWCQKWSDLWFHLMITLKEPGTSCLWGGGGIHFFIHHSESIPIYHFKLYSCRKDILADHQLNQIH